MGELRALDMNEMEQVVGGGGFGFSISIGGFFGSSSSSSSVSTSATSALATLIGFNTGLLAGIYNLGVDLINGSSVSTLVSDISAISADAISGANIGKTGGLSAALSLQSSTVASIQTSLASNPLTLIGFPPSTSALA